MGIRDGKVIHHHFSKKMSSLEVVLGRSAMSMGSKLSILLHEGCRRVRNCSVELPWDMVRTQGPSGSGQNNTKMIIKSV